MTRHRLDELLVQRGLYSSRSRARDAIARGTVTVDGVVAAKPAQNTSLESRIEILDEAQSLCLALRPQAQKRTQFLQYLRQGLELP